MDEFDFIEEKPRRRFRLGAALWNMASFTLVLSTIAAAVFFTLIFLNPQSDFNPFPPPLADAAPTEQIAALDPTAAETLIEPDPSETPTPTNTPIPSATPTVATPSVTPTHAPGSYFAIQDGSPAYLGSDVFHPDLGCSFLGIAGQAFALDDAPIPGLRVQVTGTLGADSMDKLGLTGAATQYGAGSYYEIQLADEPIASEDTLQIILRDQDGEPISDPFSFSTFASCEQNLILINFKALP